MEPISIRYGESLTLPLDANDATAVSASFYVGRPGEAYTLTKAISLTDGVGVFEFSNLETKIPVGKYYYQINIVDESGEVEKYPSPKESCDGCETDFPEFVVCESLDELEVS